MKKYLILGDIFHIQKKRKKRTSGNYSKHVVIGNVDKTIHNVRHRQWKPVKQQNYTLFKRGKHIKQQDIVELYKRNELTHDYLWYFVHNDTKIERADRIEPKWIIVFCTDDGMYLHPQQPYLTRIYKQLGRTDYRVELSMMSDGTPYWVDTYIARIRRDKEAKKRYSEKKRKKK